MNGVRVDYTVNGNAGFTTSVNGIYEIKNVKHGSVVVIIDVTSPNYKVNEAMSYPLPSQVITDVTVNFTMSSSLSTEFKVSGSVTVNGILLTGVDVSYRIIVNSTTTLTGTVTTDLNGEYTINNVPHGSVVFITGVALNNYTVNETMDHIISQPITSDVVVNFTMSSSLSTDFAISGRITSNGMGLENVNVGYTVIVNSLTTLTGTVTTGVNGVYTINNVPHGSAFSITSLTLTSYSYTGTMPHPLTTPVTSNVSDLNFEMSSTSNAEFTVSGSVTVNGLLMNGVRVDYTVNGNAGFTTTVNGIYEIKNVKHGSVVVITDVTSTNYKVNEAMSHPLPSQVITDVTVNFTMSSSLSTEFKVSGSVTSNGSPLTGVSVGYTITDSNGIRSSNVTTDGNGEYTINNVQHGSAVSVTSLTLLNYLETQGSLPYTLSLPVTSDVTINLTMDSTSSAEFIVSGNVTINGLSLIGVIIDYTINGNAGKISTDANGEYSITKVKHGSAFEITGVTYPNLIADQPIPYTLSSPVTSDVIANITMSSTSVDEFTVSGKVTVSGSPLENVRIDHTVNGNTGTVFTDQHGEYSITNVKHGSAVVITSVTLNNYSLNEAMPHVISSPVTDNIAVNFTMTSTSIDVYVISGNVTINGLMLPGVIISYTINGTNGSTTSLNDGTYSIQNVKHGSTVVIVDVKLNGYIVTGSMPHPLPLVVDHVNDINFEMVSNSGTTFNVSGSVTANGLPLINVHVEYTITDATGTSSSYVTTNGNGEYTINNIQHGSAVVINDVKLTDYSVLETMDHIITQPITSNVVVNFTMTSALSVTFTVSGKVTINGIPLQGVTIDYTLVNRNIRSIVTTGVNGEYDIKGILHGTAFTINSVTLTNYSVNEKMSYSIPVPIIKDHEDVDFTMSSTSNAKFVVSGKVTINGLPLNNVSVAYTLNDGTATTPGTVTTDLNGIYTINSVPHGSAVVITNVTSNNYAVNETMDHIITQPITSDVIVNFTMRSSLSTDFTVSGSVTVNGLTMQGADVSYRIIVDSLTTLTGTVTTDMNGEYTINSVPHGSAVSITDVKLNDYAVNETMDHVISTPVVSNIVVNFTMRSSSSMEYDISGHVTINGLPLPNVDIFYTINGNAGKITTNADGKYEILNVKHGSAFAITSVTLTNYRFDGTLPYRESTPLTSDIVVDMTMISTSNAEFAVSGSVKTNGLPLPGVTIYYTVNGSSEMNTTTDPKGEYSINVKHGSAFEITRVTLTNYSVNEAMPETLGYPISGNVANINFTMSSTSNAEFTVSGSVTANGLPLANVSVGYSINGSIMNITTDAYGKYEITKVKHGSAFEIVSLTLTNYRAMTGILPYEVKQPISSDIVIPDLTMISTSNDRFLVSGSVLSNGLPLNNVLVGYSINGGSGTVRTNANGEYSVTAAHGSAFAVSSATLSSYEVNESLPYALSTPITSSVRMNDLTMRSSSNAEFSVSGSVKINGLPLDSVRVEYTIDGNPGFVMTNTNGNYTVNNVRHGSVFAITDAKLNDYTVLTLPAALSTPITSDIKGHDIIMESTSNAVFTVSGNVTINGLPVVGAVVNYTINGSSLTTTTDANGEYTINNIKHGSAFAITSVISSGYAVDGSIPNVNVPVTSDLTMNDIVMRSTSSATFTVSGKITSNGIILVGVTVSYTINNGTIMTTTTGSDGSYAITNIRHGSAVEIIDVTLPGFTVNDNMTHPIPLPVTSNVINVNFTMTPPPSTFILTVLVKGHGYVDVHGDGISYLSTNQSVTTAIINSITTLTLTAKDGRDEFAKFIIDGTSNENNPATVTISSHMFIEAVFETPEENNDIMMVLLMILGVTVLSFAVLLMILLKRRKEDR
jgi:hypothetical protein